MASTNDEAVAATPNLPVSIFTEEFTPKTLRLIAEYCGDGVALGVWHHYGGGHLSVPSKVTEDHHLAQNLGLQDALLLCEKFSGELFQVPKANKILIMIRNQVIRRQRQQGKLQFQLAREHKLTERQIQTICSSTESSDDKQLDWLNEL